MKGELPSSKNRNVSIGKTQAKALVNVGHQVVKPLTRCVQNLKKGERVSSL